MITVDRFACVSRKRFIQFGSAKGSRPYLKTSFNLLLFLRFFFIFFNYFFFDGGVGGWGDGGGDGGGLWGGGWGEGGVKSHLGKKTFPGDGPRGRAISLFTRVGRYNRYWSWWPALPFPTVIKTSFSSTSSCLSSSALSITWLDPAAVPRLAFI